MLKRVNSYKGEKKKRRKFQKEMWKLARIVDVWCYLSLLLSVHKHQPAQAKSIVSPAMKKTSKCEQEPVVNISWNVSCGKTENHGKIDKASFIIWCVRGKSRGCVSVRVPGSTWYFTFGCDFSRGWRRRLPAACNVSMVSPCCIWFYIASSHSRGSPQQASHVRPSNAAFSW